uniref:Uncharacterized protein n=1 Tax=Aegilops tauschii subsp. strangulata TaxID=200361 RepID=A0A453NF19_AEGTS
MWFIVESLQRLTFRNGGSIRHIAMVKIQMSIHAVHVTHYDSNT